MVGALFQHANRIAPSARFLSPTDTLTVKTTERGAAKRYRKGQVHPSVFIEAMRASVGCAREPISPKQCCVFLCGGTPEGAVAATVLGFRHIFYLADDENEAAMMRLPSAEAERSRNIDYFNYIAEDPMNPSGGVLAAEAVRQLVPYLANYVDEIPDTFKIAPLTDITPKPLQQYYYVPLTKQIRVRTIDHDADKKKKKKPPHLEATEEEDGEDQEIKIDAEGRIEEGGGEEDEEPEEEEEDVEDEEAAAEDNSLGKQLTQIDSMMESGQKAAAKKKRKGKAAAGAAVPKRKRARKAGA